MRIRRAGGRGKDRSGRGALLAGTLGLGLSVARLLVEGMGGALEYRRIAGETRFSLIVPLAGSEAAVPDLPMAERPT